MADEVAYPEEYDESPKMPQDRAEKVKKLSVLRIDNKYIVYVFGS